MHTLHIFFSTTDNKWALAAENDRMAAREVKNVTGLMLCKKEEEEVQRGFHSDSHSSSLYFNFIFDYFTFYIYFVLFVCLFSFK